MKFTEELVDISWVEFKLFIFQLKEIWPLFSPTKAKKPRSFFNSLDESMKPNLSQKAMKFTEELVDISWVEFKLFISNWKRFDLDFPLLKPKKWAHFLCYKCASFVPVCAGSCINAT